MKKQKTKTIHRKNKKNQLLYVVHHVSCGVPPLYAVWIILDTRISQKVVHQKKKKKKRITSLSYPEQFHFFLTKARVSWVIEVLVHNRKNRTIHHRMAVTYFYLHATHKIELRNLQTLSNFPNELSAKSGSSSVISSRLQNSR